MSTESSHLIVVSGRDHAGEVESWMGAENQDLSYAVALDISHAELAKSGRYGQPADISELDSGYAIILSEFDWTTAFFRATSVTHDEATVERFARAHGTDTPTAEDELRSISGFRASLTIGKPLVAVKPVDTFTRLPNESIKALEERLADKYGYGGKHERSWSPLPTLIARVDSGKDPQVQLVLCPEGTECEYTAADPAAIEGNEEIPLSTNTLHPDELATMNDLYTKLRDESRVLLPQAAALQE